MTNPTTSLRVLHIVPAKPYGGIQRVVAQLASAQVRNGVDARVLSLYNDDDFSSDSGNGGWFFQLQRIRVLVLVVVSDL